MSQYDPRRKEGIDQRTILAVVLSLIGILFFNYLLTAWLS